MDGVKRVAGGCLLILLSGLTTLATASRLLDVQRIWDQAPHNAFTDLIRYKGDWYCAFREGTTHASMDGTLRVLTSPDGVAWASAAQIAGGNDDLRDAKLSVTPSGQLMLSGGSRLGTPVGGQTLETLAWFSDDGSTWGQAQPIGDPNVWLWSVTWHEGTAYGVGYRKENPRVIRLYRSTDGVAWDTVADNIFPGTSYCNETSLVFAADGTCHCLLRRDSGTNTAQLGTAQAPYTNWSWKDLGAQIGGPKMIQLPDGRFVAATRLYDGGTRTSLQWVDVDNGSLTEFLRLPSGGDTSYAGMVWHDDKLWVSYYSSHEAKTSIYLAQVQLTGPGVVVEHVGDADPTTEGFVLDHNATPTLGPGTDEEAHWRIQQIGSRRAMYYMLPDAADFSHPDGWTLTAVAKLNMADAIFNATIEARDGTSAWSLSLLGGPGSADTGVFASDGAHNLVPLTYDDPTAGYRTYQVYYDPDGDGGRGCVTYYLDGSPIGTQTRDDVPGAASLWRIVFGDNSSTAGGPTDSQWALVRLQTGYHVLGEPVIPEPATVIWVAVGSLAALRRRRAILCAAQRRPASTKACARVR